MCLHCKTTTRSRMRAAADLFLIKLRDIECNERHECDALKLNGC